MMLPKKDYRRGAIAAFACGLSLSLCAPLAIAGEVPITQEARTHFQAGVNLLCFHELANTIYVPFVENAAFFALAEAESGGSVKGVLRAVDVMLPMIDDNTKVIPGHGPLSSKKDVLAYRKMIATAISNIEPMVKSGKTLQQVIDAKPLRDYDEEWGKFRKTDAFVEILYSGLAPKKK